VNSLRAVGEFFIRVFAFARKEMMAILRQPRLVLILIMGPFLILLLFGIGYRNTERERTVMIVIPEGSPIRAQIEAMISRFGGVTFTPIVSDVQEADRALRAGEVDVLLIAPADPMASISSGRQAEVELRHAEIDPLEVLVVDAMKSLLTDIINRDVIIEAVLSGKAQVGTIHQRTAAARRDAETVQAQLLQGDFYAATLALNSLTESVQLLAFAMKEGLATFEGIQHLQDAPPGVTGILGSMAEAERLTAELEKGLDPVSRSFAQEAEMAGLVVQEFARIETALEAILALDPVVVARPFVGVVANANHVPLGTIDFYVPGVIALLLQHMAVTLAALSIVREVRGGSIELFRAAPISALETLLGKTISFLLLTGALAAVLSALVIFGLRVPMFGAWPDYALTLAVLLFTSISLGFAISVISETDTQAVQLAMIVLLASIFFSGFFIALHRLADYVQVVSWLLPATYGTALLKEIMLRGWALNWLLLGGLLLLGVLFFAFSWYRLRRLMASV